MRKILLGTTAVAGAALFAVSTAQAQQAPTIRLGGYIDVSYLFVNDSADQAAVTPSFAPTTPRRAAQQDIRTDAEIVVTVAGKAANGLEYGMTMELEMDALGVSGSSNGRAGAGTGVGTDELWAFLSSPTLGTIRFGDEDSAANLMQVRVPTLATNGTSGRWTDAVNHDGAARYGITSMNDGADRSKIIYMSPQFAGFDFGVSFSPNGGEGERERFGIGPTSGGATGSSTAAALQRGLTSTTNEITAAIRYRGTIGPVGVAAGAAATRADAPVSGVTVPRIADGSLATGLQDPVAYALGLTLSTAGFTIGGEYMTGKFGIGSGGNGAIANTRGNSTTWAVGATYTTGPLSVGAFYAYARSDTDSVRVVSGSDLVTNARGDRTQTVIGLGVEYLIAPGLTGYANYASIEDKNLEAATGTRATGQNRNIDFFIAGINLAF